MNNKPYTTLLSEANINTSLKGLRPSKIEKILNDQQNRGEIKNFHMEQFEGAIPEKLSKHLNDLGVDKASLVLKGPQGKKDHMVNLEKNQDGQWRAFDKKGTIPLENFDSFILISTNTSRPQSYSSYNKERDVHIGAPKPGTNKKVAQGESGQRAEFDPTGRKNGEEIVGERTDPLSSAISNALRKMGNISSDIKPYICTLPANKIANNKIVGFEAGDGKSRTVFRFDFDPENPKKGAHINIEIGEGNARKKFAFLYDQSQKGYENLINRIDNNNVRTGEDIYNIIRNFSSDVSFELPSEIGKNK